jgi:hypothetical protein
VVSGKRVSRDSPHASGCMGGYVFEKERAKQLDLAWKDMLDRYDLPYFHMVDCAHGNKLFKKLGSEKCDAVAREVISLLREHVLFGFATAVVEREYEELFPPPSPFGSAYTYCCWTALSVIHEWILRNQFNGKVAYFFEAGHKSEGEADAIMTKIFKNRDLKKGYRYSAHAFISKKNHRLIQTADVLAWHHATDVKKLLTNKPRRKDFAALIENQPLMLRFIAREHLEGMRRRVDAALAGRVLVSGTFGATTFVSDV